MPDDKKIDTMPEEKAVDMKDEKSTDMPTEKSEKIEATEVTKQPKEASPKEGYKKNWGKWIAIYVVVAVVLYGLIYYVMAANSSDTDSTDGTSTSIY